MKKLVAQQQLEEIKGDFRKFVYVLWKHLSLPDPTPVQYDISKFLQHGPKRSMISAFRGVGKSWLTSAYVVWLLLNDAERISGPLISHLTLAQRRPTTHLA